MATIKAFTDISQSKKLAEILPLESADMCYSNDGTAIKIDANPYTVRYSMWKDCVVEIIPCWSLAALLSVIPIMISSIFEKDALRLRIDKSKTDFNIWYDNIDTGMVEEGFDIIETNPIDACYEMIIKLSELNML